ncbi:MAG: cellulase family glycosylhydrolase [Cytophagales bacterium]|nr:cellulase family glycosylhydrolase [Cytophaga sp.]
MRIAIGTITGLLLSCICIFTSVAKFTPADFLKANGTVLRNHSGTGNIITLRGTNLGSWLSLEAWIGPVGATLLDRKAWIATASSTASGTQLSTILDGNKNTFWQNDTDVNENDSTWLRIDLGMACVMVSIVFQGTFQEAFNLSVSEDGIKWTRLPKRTMTADRLSAVFNAQKVRYAKIWKIGNALTLNSVSECKAYIDDDFSIRNTLIRRFGETKTDKLLDTYQNVWIQPADLDSIKAMGMNMVRVPVYWMELMNNAGEMKSMAWKQLDWLISECSKRNIYVIIDLHGAPGGLDGFITSGQASANAIWSTKLYQERTVMIWQSIAARYKGNPTVAAYDLMNEPVSNDSLMTTKALYDILYKAIRSIDPDHIISMQAFFNFDFLGAPASNGWNNVLYQVHYYCADGDNIPSHDIQNGFMNWAISDLSIHQRNWNVPVYAGEYNFWSFTDLWTKWMDALNSANISWSNWSYKMRKPNDILGHDPNAVKTGKPVSSNWGLYDTNLNPLPDIDQDTPDEMIAKWKKFSTSAFRANTALIEVVTQGAHATNAFQIGNTISLKNKDGGFISSRDTMQIYCNISDAELYETFLIVDAGNGSIALKASNGKYVSAGKGMLSCSKESICKEETFLLIDAGDHTIALLSTKGFVSYTNMKDPMNCSKQVIGERELFFLRIVSAK